jgi:phage baseplate assembly protein W
MAIVVRKTKTTPQTAKPLVYSDFYSNFDLELVKKDLLSYKNEDSVKRSIRNILLTDRGERFFNPTFGSDIRKMLFENFSPATEQVVADLIKTAIGNHEPRANVIDVNVSGNPDQNSMYINIVFSVINKAEPVTLELILNRIR